MDDTGVTPLRDSDRDDAAAALSRAFFDDPLQSFVLPDPNERERLSPAFFNCVLRHGQLFGEVYGTHEARAAAVWLPLPRSAKDAAKSARGPLSELPAVIGDAAMQRSDQIMKFLDEFHKRDAPGSHWYLGVIGVDPGMQGNGIGRSLVEHVVARADAVRLPCYLETAQPANVQFYINRGFEVKVETVEPESGLRLWTFLRAAC